MNRILRSQLTGMNFHYLHYPLPYFLDAMALYGFEKIELWGAAPHLYVEDASLSEIHQVKQEIVQRGLEVVCFTPEQCMYPINLAAKEKEIRDRSLRYFKKSMDISVELECPMVLVTAGWGYRNEPMQEAWDRAKESLHNLCDYAEQRGLTLALEPLSRVESNLITDLPTLTTMLDAISSPALKGMVDTVPMAMLGEELRSYFDRLGDDLIHIHFIDGNPGGHLAWGDGCLPLESLMETLCEVNYTGALSLEFTSAQYLENPNLAVEKSLKRLEPYLRT
ncbi:TIM barrel protein [Ammoniphilus sp. YIM 78166]|uniref:TIM barrel protein n=1 Tax=Ammoniphilus sp. YIM 78166 TaxID=1644106 RepID=UPI0014317B5B|nr:TIM barrel protein [Ammoniphilus sp. YIM 78166]